MPKQKLPKAALPISSGETFCSPVLTKRGRHLLRKYGISEEQYQELFSKQEGRCAVCQRTAETFKQRLCVDHDHKTGEIRGLLCIHCNRYIVGRHRRGIGADLLNHAFNYLTRDYPGWIIPVKKKRKKSSKARRKRRLKDG